MEEKKNVNRKHKQRGGIKGQEKKIRKRQRKGKSPTRWLGAKMGLW